MDFSVTFGIPLALALILTFERLSQPGSYWGKRWADREYDVVDLHSNRKMVPRVLLSLLAIGAGYYYDSWAAAAAFPAIVWLAVLASQTDLRQRKIPKEPCWTVFAVATLLGVSTFAPASAASAATALVIILVLLALLILLVRGGIGSGDARLLIALTSAAWWTGYSPFLFGLLLAGVLQVILRYSIYRGRYVGKGYPFAPALVAGLFLAVAVFGDPQSACREWVLMLSCGM